MGAKADKNGGAGRAATILAWGGGGAAGVLLSYAFVYLFHDAYPSGIGTFVLFAGGAMAFMAWADKLGDRALKVIGPIAGVLLAIALVLLGAIGFAGVPN